MPHTKRTTTTIKTTIAELAAAYYDAALAEVKDPRVAARIADEMLKEALRRRR
jgi:hypothetical protein